MLSNYSKTLLDKGIRFKLVEFLPVQNTWKYQLSCIKPISGAEKLEKLFEELHHLVEDLILDGYDIKIIENFYFLIRRPD